MTRDFSIATPSKLAPTTQPPQLGLPRYFIMSWRLHGASAMWCQGTTCAAEARPHSTQHTQGRVGVSWRIGELVQCILRTAEALPLHMELLAPVLDLLRSAMQLNVDGILDRATHAANRRGTKREPYKVCDGVVSDSRSHSGVTSPMGWLVAMMTNIHSAEQTC